VVELTGSADYADEEGIERLSTELDKVPMSSLAFLALILACFKLKTHEDQVRHLSMTLASSGHPHSPYSAVSAAVQSAQEAEEDPSLQCPICLSIPVGQVSQETRNWTKNPFRL